MVGQKSLTDIRRRAIHKKVIEVVLRKNEKPFTVDQILRLVQRRPRYIIVKNSEPLSPTKIEIIFCLIDLERNGIVKTGWGGEMVTVPDLFSS